jgi:hypothetical protein
MHITNARVSFRTRGKAYVELQGKYQRQSVQISQIRVQGPGQFTQLQGHHTRDKQYSDKVHTLQEWWQR